MEPHKKKKLCSVEEVAELRRTGMKIYEIAEKLDISPTTVDVNIKKAKKQGLLPENPIKKQKQEEYVSYGKAKADKFLKEQPKIDVSKYEKEAEAKQKKKRKTPARKEKRK